MRKIFSRIEGVPIASSGGRLPSSEPESFTLGSRTLHVEEIIAEGGFGVVFLVRPSGTSSNGSAPSGSSGSGTRLALKRMFVNNDRDLSICKREINIVSSLSGHPHLIGYVDSSVTGLRDGVTEILLLMPYHKKNLLGLMNDLHGSGGSFPQSEVLKIFTELASAVGRLHHCSTPIIHRDLKVENILRSEDNKYILCDFGSATIRVLNPSTQGIHQVEEEIKRYTTLAYRAPEMVDLYSNKPLTTKIDIWALGCLLYYICFFSLPFGDSSLAIQSGTFSFPKKHAYSDSLLKLIRYLLTPDMDSRPDIFQASYLACLIANKECTVQNLHNVSLPNLDSLPLTLPSENTRSPEPARTATRSAEEKRVASGANAAATSAAPVLDKMTSIAPRQRPKGSKAPLAGNQILPPLPNNVQGNTAAAAASGDPHKLSEFVAPPPPEVTEQQPHPTTPSAITNSNPSTAASVIPSATPNSVSNTAPNSWNPFSDTKCSSSSSKEEDAFFGEAFDRLRAQDPPPKRDPFGSAPFFK